MSICDNLYKYMKTLFKKKKMVGSEITKKNNEILNKKLTMKDPMFDYGNKYAAGYHTITSGGGGGMWASTTWPSTTTTSPSSIKNIQNPTEEQIISALKYNGLELKYVKNQTEKHCMIAIAENPFAMGLVINQTKELCIMALKLDYRTLGYIRYPTKNIIDKAIEINPECYIYINKEKFPNEYHYAHLKCI